MLSFRRLGLLGWGNWTARVWFSHRLYCQQWFPTERLPAKVHPPRIELGTFCV